MPQNATNASCCLNRPLASKGVKTIASAAANNLSIGQSTSATTINEDLLAPKLGPKIAHKKGIRPLKLIVARSPLVVSVLAYLVLALGALKATVKATTKKAIGKKVPPKARITSLKRLTRNINKR